MDITFAETGFLLRYLIEIGSLDLIQTEAGVIIEERNIRYRYDRLPQIYADVLREEDTFHVCTNWIVRK